MPTLLGVTTKALRALRVGESIIVETVNQTRTQRAAGAAASYASFEWKTAWDLLPAHRFQAREGRCERLVKLGLLESKLMGVDIVYRRVVTQPPLTVIAAAVRHHGVIFSMPRPHRHHHILHAQTALGLRGPAHRDQGFLLSDGTFADRAAAWIIAMNAKQFKGKPHHPEHLFSEDLW